MTQKNKKSLTAPVNSNPKIACPKTYEFRAMTYTGCGFLIQNQLVRSANVFGRTDFFNLGLIICSK